MSVELPLILMLQILEPHVPLTGEHGLVVVVSDAVRVVCFEVTGAREALHDVGTDGAADLDVHLLWL